MRETKRQTDDEEEKETDQEKKWRLNPSERERDYYTVLYTLNETLKEDHNRCVCTHTRVRARTHAA